MSAVFTNYAINAKLVAESGRIGTEIYQRTLNTSAWQKLVKQSFWPDEMGSVIQALTYERSLPSSALTWQTIGFNPDQGVGSPQTGGTDEGNCLPPVQTVPFAQTLRSYSLAQTALVSPDICLNDLRFPFARQQQLGAMMKVLTMNTKYHWDDRHRNEYFRSCGHKVILKAGTPENTTTTVDPNSYVVGNTLFPNQTPTSTLTQSYLDKFAIQLMSDGAGDQNPLARAEGMPVFGLITSPQTSADIIKNNADIRNDFRWSDDREKELLAPLGIRRNYMNFAHIPDLMTPRYDWINGSGYIRRPFYSSTAASYGNKQQVNPDYVNAAYEVSFIFHQDVMESLVPKPLTSPGGNTMFETVNYRGDWKWLNIPDKDRNPDGLIGFFRALMQNATKPVTPEWGYAIMHQRCQNPTGLACAAT